MWIKCEDRLPPKDGIYMTVERGFMHSYLYRIASFKKNLGKVIDLEEHRGESGFYDSDSEWGSFVIKPLAWKYIEKYRGVSVMAKYREAPCKYYVNEGNCEKGRDGTYKSYCQKCSKYEPRKGYVSQPNKKKEDKWKYHES